MAWNIELSPRAEKYLEKMGIGSPDATRILKFLYQGLALADDPRSTGKALVGPTLSGLWRYRVGDYRIFCHILDEKICIVIIEIGHRREVYKKQ
jgi:mRNA interferase RelE/StbE